MFHVNQPGAWIHHTDPFATPGHERSPVRRLRGRLAAAVALWTAGGPGVGDGGTPEAGLTMSSTLIADGDPARLLGLVDEESELWEAVRHTGRFAVAVLGPSHRQLADRFAGLLPAPGGLFKGQSWARTAYGPVPADVRTWAGCRLDDVRECGYALLVQATIQLVEVAADPAPLIHYRGRYRELAD